MTNGSRSLCRGLCRHCRKWGAGDNTRSITRGTRHTRLGELACGRHDGNTARKPLKLGFFYRLKNGRAGYPGCPRRKTLSIHSIAEGDQTDLPGAASPNLVQQREKADQN